MKSPAHKQPDKPSRGNGGRGNKSGSAQQVPHALLATALQAQWEGSVIAKVDRNSPKLTIVHANPSLCTLVGRSLQELVGSSQHDLHADQIQLADLSNWMRTAQPEAPFKGDGCLRRKDGTLIHAAWSFMPIAGPRGKVSHVVTTYRDQTERRLRQDALVHNQRLDAIYQLAGSMAHDFNNLLSVINGYCEILAARVANNPQAMREVAEIHYAGRKAATLTQQLLTFSRQQPFNARVINLNQLIQENAAILQRLVGDAGTIEFALAPTLPNVRTDPAQFQQVLLNLVLNARDALRDNGRILISTACREVPTNHHRRATDLLPGPYVILTVNDNGTGMDAETQRRLFEPFFTTKPEGKGTGLGLAMVYGVVQQSRGDIAVHSALLVGSTFEILLPVTAEERSEAPPVVVPLPTTKGHEVVALVEEDEVVRKMVAGILTADGYSVIAAGSFAELAEQPAPHQPVQLLITSASREASHEVRNLLRQNPALCVLCVRSTDQAPDKIAGIPTLRQSSLAKPYALSELLRAARQLLEA